MQFIEAMRGHKLSERERLGAERYLDRLAQMAEEKQTQDDAQGSRP
jgi:hypothetical protein